MAFMESKILKKFTLIIDEFWEEYENFFNTVKNLHKTNYPKIGKINLYSIIIKGAEFEKEFYF